jgi:hypothetical protein
MSVALLIVLLFTGEGKAEIVDRETCLQVVDDVDSGKVVNIIDHDGSYKRVEKAKCILDFRVLMQEANS